MKWIANMYQPTYQLTKTPVTRVEMLIRRPVTEVFEAFVNPAITTRFWFTKSSGRLEPGNKIRWEWEMYGASSEVDVKVVELNSRILIEWSDYDTPTVVEWLFTPRGEGATLVSITNSGFRGSGDQVVKDAMDSTGGFALVLAGLKALLEHGLQLNLITDRFPDQVVKG